jgi:transposase-like protein
LDLRVKRKFSDQFKREAIQHLGNRSGAEVARECGVSVSVLHRWRKQLTGHRTKPRERRVFSKEFKETVVGRLESGEPVGDAALALQLDPTVIRRWRHEWRKYGAAAFTGYGKSRSPAPSARTVIVRFTEDEYESVKAASVALQAGSLPEFVRAQILPRVELLSVGEIATRLDALIDSLQCAADGLGAL